MFGEKKEETPSIYRQWQTVDGKGGSKNGAEKGTRGEKEGELQKEHGAHETSAAVVRCHAWANGRNENVS